MPTKPLASRRQPPPKRRLWTRREFDRAEWLGLFGAEERLELIEGEILVKELPWNAPHATAQRRTEKTLSRVFAEGYDVRGQLPLAAEEFGPLFPNFRRVQERTPGFEE